MPHRPTTPAVKELSRHLQTLTCTHDLAADRVICYLYHTHHLGLTYSRSPQGLLGYTDSNFANCIDTHRSTSRYDVSMFRGGPISWQSKVQPTVSQSTAEAEVRALNSGSLDIVWLCCMLTDLMGCTHTNSTPMAQDNVACEQWTRNPHNHAKQKHIARGGHLFPCTVFKGGIPP